MIAQELFVWYRCTPAEAPGVEAAAHRLLDQVARSCGVRGRLLVRRDDTCTWMEHYQADTPQALQALRDAAREHWPARLPARHEECFGVVPAAQEAPP